MSIDVYKRQLVTSAIAYAENCLGQIYKVRQDGQYRGGPYFYMERGKMCIRDSLMGVMHIY